MPRLSYQEHVDYVNRKASETYRSGRDVASDYHINVDKDRREAGRLNLRTFLEAYFPEAFSLSWSSDHLLVIERMQDTVFHGGLYAIAMPRGSGKTSIVVRAALWALLYAHRKFVCLVAATEKKACELLDMIKVELQYNELLATDFPEVAHCIRKLENNARRCIGQLFAGDQTNIEWTDERVTFPTVPDSACIGINVSGYTISVAGITGAIRGQTHTLKNGRVIRPEFVILDDPQSRESAMSVTQSASRAAIVKGDVLGMAGPGQRVAAFMPCTVIRKGDMADELLDNQKSPMWQGHLMKMVYRFPDNMALWDRYKKILDDGGWSNSARATATEFYAGRQAEMDQGAAIAWPDRLHEDELSAIQHCMNLRFLVGEEAFFAEYQNTPIVIEEPGSDDLTADQITARFNRIPHCVLPTECDHLTQFIDIQGSLLYYVTCAWTLDFTGFVVDYGTYPDQDRAYFRLVDARNTLDRQFPTMGLEGRIHAGLEALCADTVGMEWEREDGITMRISRCLIDANWAASTETVINFCQRSAHAAVLVPAHGHGISADQKPMREWDKKLGEQQGDNWRLRPTKGAKHLRSVVFDSNYWKSFIRTRLSVAPGDRGALTLFGDRAEIHRLFAEQLTAETGIRTEGRGRKVDIWRHRPDRFDNHWLDGIVGCAVAASMQGCALPSIKAPPAPVQTGGFAALRARKQR